MNETKKYLVIAMLTVASVAAVTSIWIAGAIYLQDRDYKAANELLNTSAAHVEKAFLPTTSNRIQRPAGRQAMKYVGTISNETGSFEVLQDQQGKYHYVRKNTP